jgi:hypothetical protein
MNKQLTIPKHQDQTVVLRLVEYKDEKDRCYRVITNRWDLSAQEISEIYRDRWAVELFFKWMKQHHQLVKLYSSKPEAVWNQIYIGLIAYCLCALVKIQRGTKRSTWVVLRLIRLYMFKQWNEFLDELNRPPTKASKGRRKKGKPGRPRMHPEKPKAQKSIVRQRGLPTL